MTSTTVPRNATGSRGTWVRTPWVRAVLGFGAGVYVLMVAAWTVRTTLYAYERGGLDLFLFLASSLQFRAGLPPYDQVWTVLLEDGSQLGFPNLNHPVMILLVLPLTWLSTASAVLVWEAASLVAGAVAVRVLYTWLPRRPGRTFWLTVLPLAVASPGLVFTLQLAQVSLFLLPVLVLAWLALADRRWARAGAVVGVLVALKPFLAPLLLLFVARRRWSGLVAAASSGLGVSALALAVVGTDAFLAWLQVLGQVWWYDHRLNISLTGVLDRATAGPLPEPAAWIPFLVLTPAALALWARLGAWRDTLDPCLLASSLLVFSLLTSPLGWLYYTPLLAPAFFTLLARRHLLSRAAAGGAVTAGLLLSVPHSVPLLAPQTAVAQLTVGAVHTYGLLALLLVLSATLWSEADRRADAASDDRLGLRLFDTDRLTGAPLP